MAESYVCPNCHATWPITNGVVRFFQPENYYWGEVERAKAQELLQWARADGWREAVMRRFGGTDMEVTLLDLQRAAWIPLLSLPADAVAMDIGCGQGAISNSLARVVGKLYSVEAVNERVEFTQTRLQQEGFKNFTVVQASATQLPFQSKSFDLIVVNGVLEWVGEWDLTKPPRQVQLDFLKTIRELLKDDGVLLVGIENRIAYSYFLGEVDHTNIAFTSLMPRKVASWYMRMSSTKHHRTQLNPKQEYRIYTYSAGGYNKLFSEAGFRSIESYWSDPGYNRPYRMIPLEASDSIQEHVISELEFAPPRRSKGWLRAVKRMMVRSGLFRHMVPDFVFFLSSQPHRTTAVAQQFARAIEAASGKPVVPESIRMDQATYAFHNKDAIRFHLPAAARDFIGKAAVAEGIPSLEQEFTGETIASAHLKKAGVTTVTLPEPLQKFSHGKVLYTLERKAKGVNFRELITRSALAESSGALREALHAIERLMRAAIELSIALKDCTEGPRFAAQPCDAASHASSARTQSEGYAQHGDFTLFNAFWVRSSDVVEMIDWASFGTGYPPLYDVFSAAVSISSCALSETDPGSIKSKSDYRVKAFAELLYGKSAWAATTRAMLSSAFDQLGLPIATAQSRMVDFLIVRTNLYRLIRSPEAELHQAFLQLVMEKPFGLQSVATGAGQGRS